ncbi:MULTISPECIES: hypothetical protein [unclassified Beijerinckia]|uniref:hypothetical protein n=1 Tax=unclassified Beijerinckia TaxID=2638183 RepID=UPI00089C8615|nr:MULTISPECIES: hypothetical protein [unclassified Beijerinckia]MDH7794957.1 hypothetical protein [Beijerinckia sp. GAS462]SEB81887.1 hypothetical protein SAMN05443249_1230 [Beijerinckia sp. 28-YEA-48]
MKLRSLAHCLVLALFMAAGTLSAFVSPAKAGYGMPGGENAAMEAGMPCCPSDDGKTPDCATHCPALNLCLIKSFASGAGKSFVNLVLPVVAVIALEDDAARSSRLSEPPARPPRTVSIAGA